MNTIRDRPTIDILDLLGIEFQMIAENGFSLQKRRLYNVWRA